MPPGRQRDYAKEYARRQELARERGFGKSGLDPLYEQRLKGGAARAKASTPLPTGAARTHRRGHGRFSAFLRAVEPESMVAVGTNLGNIIRTENGWEDIPVVVYTMDGDELEFNLLDITEDELDWLLDELDDRDVDYSPDYNLGALVP